MLPNVENLKQKRENTATLYGSVKQTLVKVCIIMPQTKKLAEQQWFSSSAVFRLKSVYTY